MKLRIHSKVRTTLGPSKHAVRLHPGKSLVVEKTVDEMNALLAYGNGHGEGLLKAGLVRIEEVAPETAATESTDVEEPKGAATEPARTRTPKPKKTKAAEKTEPEADDSAGEKAGGDEGEPKGD